MDRSRKLKSSQFYLLLSFKNCLWESTSHRVLNIDRLSSLLQTKKTIEHLENLQKTSNISDNKYRFITSFDMGYVNQLRYVTVVNVCFAHYTSEKTKDN